MEKRILTAVFSASGRTKRVGEEIARISGSDFFEIVPKEIYTSDDLNWVNRNSRSSIEMNDPAARPEISGTVDDMDSYDTVIIGYPIWWGVAPRIIETFLESYDFSGKTIIPFCTSGGSGLGRSDTALHKNVSGDVKWTDQPPAGVTNKELAGKGIGISNHDRTGIQQDRSTEKQNC